MVFLHPTKTCAVALTAALGSVMHSRRHKLKCSSRTLLAQDKGDQGEYSYDDIHTRVKDLNDDILQSGSSGDVYSMGNGTVVKRIRPDALGLGEVPYTMREIMLSKYLEHECLLLPTDIPLPKNKDRFQKDGCFLVMPQADDFDKLLRGFDLDIDEDRIRHWMFDILQGVAYLHSAGVTHRDLKTANLLMDSKGRLKICDFDLSRVLYSQEDVVEGEANTPYVGTEKYVAPEMMALKLGMVKDTYTKVIDLWAVGCIMANLYARYLIHSSHDKYTASAVYAEYEGLFGIKKDKPLAGDNKIESYIETMKAQLAEMQRMQKRANKISASAKNVHTSVLDVRKNLLRQIIERSTKVKRDVMRGTVVKYLPPDSAALDLMGQLLDFNPDTRISAKAALQHPFFESITKEKCKAYDNFEDWFGETCECDHNITQKLRGLEQSINAKLVQTNDVNELLFEAAQMELELPKDEAQNKHKEHRHALGSD